MSFISYIKFGFFIILFLAIYTLANYYVGIRGYRAFNKMLPFLTAKVFWIIFWFIAFSYMISILGRNFLPQALRNPFTTIGVYWMAALFYLVLILPLVDISRYIFHKTPFATGKLGTFTSFL